MRPRELSMIVSAHVDCLRVDALRDVPALAALEHSQQQAFNRSPFGLDAVGSY